MAKNGKVKGSGIVGTGLVVGALCVACCAVPLLGVFGGSAAMAGFAVYSERLAFAVLVIAAGVLIFKLSRRKSGAACRLDKGCGPVRDVDGDGT